MALTLVARHARCRNAGDSPAGSPGADKPATGAGISNATQPTQQAEPPTQANQAARTEPPVFTRAWVPAGDAATADAAPGGIVAGAGILTADSPGSNAQTVSPQQTAAAQTVADGELAQTLLKAVEERLARAEKSVVRSMAGQNGMEEAELTRLLAQARAAGGEAAPAPESAQQFEQLKTRWRERLLAAEVKTVGTELGLLDGEVALKLMDAAALTVAEDGTVGGVREALTALKQSKGYLFGQATRGAWAQKLGFSGIPPLSGVEEAFYRKNPALRR